MEIGYETERQGRRMDIVLCFDSNYIVPAAVAVASAIASNAHDRIVFHLFVLGVGEDERERFRAIVRQPHSVIFYDMDSEAFADFPINKLLTSASVAAYFRLAIPDLLDKSVRRVLYVDCDVMVLDSLLPLFELDLGGAVIGAVPDILSYRIAVYNRLHLDLKRGYFNSGVLLIDMECWRHENCTDLCMDTIRNRTSKLDWPDQDALNLVLCDNKKWLDFRYNLQESFLYDEKSNDVYWKDYGAVKEAILNPCIVHFNALKPWFYGCRHPFADQWRDFLMQTPWKDTGLVSPKSTMLGKMKAAVKRFIMSHITLGGHDFDFSDICFEGKK